MKLFQSPPRDLSKPLRMLESPPKNWGDTPEKEDASFWGGMWFFGLGLVALVWLAVIGWLLIRLIEWMGR